MSEYSIEVSPSSRVVVFQGNLKKAPNLNRRGRKKWKDRFFVLRANKILECHKSRKAAAASSKAPRKVIDLRSCITLEVGLEYRELQHILSLGTFKKTFFFAAHSDALMLQWGDNIEKVKNASDGESIQILDIGLRKSPLRTVRHATPPTPDYKQPNPLLYKSGSSHSSSAIAQLSMPHHPILKGERSPSLPPQPTPFPPSSLNDHHPPDSDSEEFQRQQRQRSKSHDGTKRSRVYVNVSPRPPPSPKSPKQSTSSSAKPPRTLQEKSRRREGVHWAAQRAKRSGMVGDYSTGSLPQPLGKIPPPRIAYRLRKDSNSSDDSSPLSTLIAQEGLESIQGSAAAKSAPFSLRNGMQRSFRYRKIVLRQEKPIFKSVQEEDSSDDEDEETETESETSSLSSSRRILASSSPNLSEVGKSHISKTSRSGHHHLPGTAGCTQVQDYSYQPTSYSKVTVVGVKVASVSSEHHAKLHSQNKGEDSSSSEGTLPRRASDCFPLPPPSPSDTAFAEFESADCTEKHTSDTAVLHESTSLNSLDNILVDPPPMFEDPEDQLPPLPPPGYESSEQGKAPPTVDEGSRSSTESFDTGYNSSPSYNKKHGAKGGWEEINGKVHEKHCAPLVFFCPRVGRGRGKFGLQVCLVEHCAELMKKVVSVKQQEGYSLIECDQECANAPAVTKPDRDSLTVETSLEDIEFGFSVVKTTQKDTFDGGVREFQFELCDLFSTASKPFSCEVHIRHADEVTVLPVEVERN